MPGKTPGKVTRGYPSQKSWQNVWRDLKFKRESKDSSLVRFGRKVQPFARGCATKKTLAKCQGWFPSEKLHG